VSCMCTTAFVLGHVWLTGGRSACWHATRFLGVGVADFLFRIRSCSTSSRSNEFIFEYFDIPHLFLFSFLTFVDSISFSYKNVNVKNNIKVLPTEFDRFKPTVVFVGGLVRLSWLWIVPDATH
jgi:hypothetical protein